MTFSESCKEPHKDRGRPQKPKNRRIQSAEYSGEDPHSCEECGSSLVWASAGLDGSNVELVCPCCGLVHYEDCGSL